MRGEIVLGGVEVVLFEMPHGFLRLLREGEQHVVGMEPVGVYVYGSLCACAFEVRDVLKRLAIERLFSADIGVGRGQARIIGLAGGGLLLPAFQSTNRPVFAANLEL